MDIYIFYFLLCSIRSITDSLLKIKFLPLFIPALHRHLKHGNQKAQYRNNQNNNQQTDTSTQTSDDTAIISFVALALLALAGFWMSRKKED